MNRKTSAEILAQLQQELGPMTKPKNNNTITLSLEPHLWAQHHFGITLDAKQREVLASPANRIIVNCSRQWGKSTTAALRALRFTLDHPDSTAIIISPSLRQSGELLRKVASFAYQMQLHAKSDGINRLSLQFPNRARVIALPGNEHTTRGFSKVGLLIVDEASRVTDSNYLAARPFLATTNGALMLLSTPNGRRGFFYREWSGPGPWHRITVPATECPRISEHFLADERLSMPEALFRQEYLCEFSGTQYNYIRPEILATLNTPHFKALKLEDFSNPYKQERD